MTLGFLRLQCEFCSICFTLSFGEKLSNDTRTFLSCLPARCSTKEWTPSPQVPPLPPFKVSDYLQGKVSLIFYLRVQFTFNPNAANEELASAFYPV